MKATTVAFIAIMLVGALIAATREHVAATILLCFLIGYLTWLDPATPRRRGKP